MIFLTNIRLQNLLVCLTVSELYVKILVVADIGISPSGKAAVFDAAIRWFESNYPSQKEK